MVDVEVAGGTFVPPQEQSEITAEQRPHAVVDSYPERGDSTGEAHGDAPTATRAAGRCDGDRTDSVGDDPERRADLGGAPGYGDPITEVLAFRRAEHRDAVAIAVGLEALNLPPAPPPPGSSGVAGTGRTGRDPRSPPRRSRRCSRSTVVLWDGVVPVPARRSPEPAELGPPPGMHAAFALALPALGTTLIGAAMAAHASGLTPAWQRLLGLAGGGVLIVAGAANLAIADGSSLLFVGMPGCLAWLVWLLVTGVRLVRAGTIERSDVDALSEAEVWVPLPECFSRPGRARSRRPTGRNPGPHRFSTLKHSVSADFCPSVYDDAWLAGSDGSPEPVTLSTEPRLVADPPDVSNRWASQWAMSTNHPSSGLEGDG